MTRILLWGATAGLGWGIAARVWMRLITWEPEFSWAGTLAILGLSTLLGLGWGGARVVRAGGSRAWLLAIMPGHLLFASAGAPMLPASALGGLAWAGRRWWTRAIGVFAIIAPVVMIWQAERFNEQYFLPMSVARQTIVVLGGLALTTALGWGSSQWWRAASRADSADLPVQYH